MHKIWPGRRAHWVKYKNINSSDLDGMLLASFCQSRAVLCKRYLSLKAKWVHFRQEVAERARPHIDVPFRFM